MRSQGYDSLSDDLNQALQDTLDEVTHNADKQEQVISEMLNHVVNNYQDAYGKINQIINSTGFTPSDNLNSNLNNLNTSASVNSQVNSSNTNAPDYNPSGSAANVNTGAIQSGSSVTNNNKIESELSKEEDTSNRPVAEITLNKTNISLQEGQSATIKATVRPNDAKNKTLTWKSSNIKVATVSNGTVKAVKAGNATITVTGGIASAKTCSITVTKKPEPQKPSQQQKPTSSQGDGKVNLKDKVTFVSGSYHQDSYGGGAWGNQKLGEQVYITAYEPDKPYPVHISRGDTLGNGDLGWLKLDQIRGYYGGSRSITKGGFAWLHDKRPGAAPGEDNSEILIRQSDGAVLTKVNPGDAVMTHAMKENLFELAKINPATLIDNLNTTPSSLPIVQNVTGGDTIDVHYDSLLTINGDVTKETYPGVKRISEEVYQYTVKQLYKDAKLQGIRKTI